MYPPVASEVPYFASEIPRLVNRSSTVAGSPEALVAVENITVSCCQVVPFLYRSRVRESRFSFFTKFLGISVRKFTLLLGRFFLVACFQQVPAQEPPVTVQEPFWGDVSPYFRCRRQRTDTQQFTDHHARETVHFASSVHAQ